MVKVAFAFALLALGIYGSDALDAAPPSSRAMSVPLYEDRGPAVPDAAPESRPLRLALREADAPQARAAPVRPAALDWTMPQGCGGTAARMVC